MGGAFLLFILALPVGYSVPIMAFAENPKPGDVVLQQQTRHQYNGHTLEEQVGRIARSLNLTEEQQSAVKNILEQQKQEILKIRSTPSVNGIAGIDRVRALQERTVARIRAVLNEEQRKKYDPLAPRRIPQTPQPSVEDWLKATTPR